MCRLLGMVSAAPASPEWGLLGAPCALLAQSRASRASAQRDGWGVAWYRNHRPQWFKSPQPIAENGAMVRQLAAQAATRVAIAHIRRASNPRGLKRPALLGVENAQPYVFKNYTFAHNGALNIPLEVRESLGAWGDRVRGVNDSEILFWLFMSHIEAGHDFKTSFGRSVRHIWSVWRKSGPGRGREPYTGMNVIFSDGRALYAACHVIPPAARPAHALCSRAWPYWRMCWRADPGQVWVSSEPLDQQKNWRALLPGQYLCATVGSGSARVRTGKLSLPPLA